MTTNDKTFKQCLYMNTVPAKKTTQVYWTALCACAVLIMAEKLNDNSVNFDLNFANLDATGASISQVIQHAIEIHATEEDEQVETARSSQEVEEIEAFTAESNERFYKVTQGDLEFLASQTLAQATKDQTRWALKIFQGN